MIQPSTRADSEPATSFDKLATIYGGAVVSTMGRCGKPNCRCAHGCLHGPYYALVWRYGGIRHKRYIPATEVEAVRATCERTRHDRRAIRSSLQRSQDYLRQMKALFRDMRLEGFRP